MGVEAEKLVHLGRRCCVRKVNGGVSGAVFQEAMGGPLAVDVKSGSVGNVVDSNDLSLGRTGKVFFCEGVRQVEREALVRVSGQPTSVVPSDVAEVVNAQQLSKCVARKVHGLERVADLGYGRYWYADESCQGEGQSFQSFHCYSSFVLGSSLLFWGRCFGSAHDLFQRLN